jgi:hypothetical protein
MDLKMGPQKSVSALTRAGGRNTKIELRQARISWSYFERT